MQRILIGLMIVMGMLVGCTAPITASVDVAPVAVAEAESTAVSEAVEVVEPTETGGAEAEPEAETEPEAQPLAMADSEEKAEDEEAEAAVDEIVAEATSTTAPTIIAQQRINRSELPVRLVALEESLRAPVAIVPIPDESNRNLLLDRVGLAYFLNPSGRIPTEPFMDMRSLLERNPAGVDGYGLQGLAFDPNFVENGRFYILYSQPQLDGNGYQATLSALNTRPRNADAADLDTEEILAQFDLAQPVGHLALEEGTLRIRWADSDQPLCLTVAGETQATCGSSRNALPSLPTTLTERSGGATLLTGFVYQGVGLPTLLDHYLFAAQEDEYGRLFVARPAAANDQPWRVQYLHLTEGENGRLPATIHTIGQDVFGEMYVMTAPRDGVNGRIYKLQPHIELERSLIDGEPNDYMPLRVTYARIFRATPIYPSLDAVRAGQANGMHGGGSYWVTIRGEEEVNGKTYYYVHWSWGTFAWMSGEDLLIGDLNSSLKGFDLDKYAGGYPVAMAHRPVFVRSIPGPIIDETIVGYLDPYDIVNVYETRGYVTEEGDDEVWYRIGIDQWVHSEFVRLFTTTPRPEGVGPNDKWIEIRLTEQTVIAYEGDTPVLATLSSTGRPRFETTTGLYQVWSTLREGPMEWDNSVPPYSLANIPWIMYFNGDQALHNSYWHDEYGIVRSAGCVNLSPHDAHWLFHWAFPDRPNLRIYDIDPEVDPTIWVYVHDRALDMDEQLATYYISQTEWPETAVPR